MNDQIYAKRIIKLKAKYHRINKLEMTREELAKFLKERRAVIRFRHRMPEMRISEVSKPMAEFIEKNRTQND